jgi:hypothetical protein
MYSKDSKNIVYKTMKKHRSKGVDVVPINMVGPKTCGVHSKFGYTKGMYCPKITLEALL